MLNIKNNIKIRGKIKKILIIHWKKKMWSKKEIRKSEKREEQILFFIF